MRAIIDATGLPEAVSYYRMFPREPGRVAADDMTIDRVIPARHITMVMVLDLMQAAADADEREVLIVAHGEPLGFLMPIAPGGVAAMRDALEIVNEAATALDRRSAIRARPAAERTAAWAAFIEELAPGTVRGTISEREAERWFEHTWLSGQAHRLRVRGADVVEQLVLKRNAVQRAHFQRVEVRACNIGAEPSSLAALCRFLGARRACAPSVGTFYVGVHPSITAESAMPRWERHYGGPVHGGVYGHEAGPAARRFDVYVPAPHGVPLGFLIPEGFRIRVWETSRHPHRYAARAAAPDWADVKAWVDLNIMPASTYHRGAFVLAGMWTFGRGGEPFAVPLDRQYRDVLVCRGR